MIIRFALRIFCFRKQTLDRLPETARFKSSGLSGKNLKTRLLTTVADRGWSLPQVSLQFDAEGAKLFAELTKRDIGKQIAILLDGEIISAPTVQAEIPERAGGDHGELRLRKRRHLSRVSMGGALRRRLR